MKSTVNERIQLLKTELGCTNLEFCHRAKISNGTLNNIHSGENVSPKTIRTIAEALGVNKEWLLSGKGKMFIDIPEELPLPEKSLSARALELLEEQLKKKDEQIASLMAVISKINFLEGLNGIGTHKGTLRPAA